MTVTDDTRESSAALVVYRMGGREYPQKTARHCKVCHSAHRYEIEEQVVKGRVYSMIANSLPEGSDITNSNVRDHYRNGHMPLDIEVGRRTVEKLAIERGKSVDHEVDGIVDGITLATMVVQKTFEALMTGELRPDMKDGLAAATLLEKFGIRDDGLSETEYAQAFMAYHDSAKLAMTPEQFENFGRILSVNPMLRALAARQDDRERGVVDAEVEDYIEEAVIVYEDDDDTVAEEPDTGLQLSLTMDVPEDTSILSEHSPKETS